MCFDKELKYLLVTAGACLVAGFSLGRDTQRSRPTRKEKDPAPTPAPKTTSGSAGCFDDKTEAMTAGGFASWSSVDLNTDLAQYDMETGEVSFAKPLALIDRLHCGTMLHFCSDTVDICVTPDHDLIGLVGKPDGAAVPKFAKMPANEVAEQQAFPVTSRYDASDCSFSDLFHGEMAPSVSKAGLVGQDIKGMSQATARTIIRRLIQDYGVLSGGDVHGIVTITSRCHSLADRILVLCVVAGVVATRVPGTATVSIFVGENYVLRSCGFYPIPEKVMYGRYVWCAQMPKGTIITRRNGKIAITGNKSFG